MASKTDLGMDCLNQIGTEVRLKTCNGEDVSGSVFGGNGGDDGVVILRRPGISPYSHGITVIKRKNIEKVIESNAPANVVVASDEQLPEVDIRRMQEKEERAVKAAQLEAAKIGIGVSEKAQQLFDAISKTLPAHWEDKNIVVLEEVTITEPYDIDSLSTRNPNDTVTLERVKKVMAAEFERC